MNLGRQIVRGGLIVGGAQLLGQACGFVRTAIVARLISPENFGIAATLWVTLALLDMLSNLNIELLVTQAKEGHEPRFQRTAQLVQAWRGFGSAVVMFVLAYPISYLFGVPQAAWAFQCLALYPLIRGLGHLDLWRFQRELRFGPAAVADIASQVVALALAVPVTVWRPNYEALLWLALLQTATCVLVSHYLAERRYGWGWEQAHGKRIFDFGWPLLLSGILLFLVMQGDQFIIGAARRIFPHAYLTLHDLALFAVAATLVMMPTVVIGKICASLMLPVLAHSPTQEQYLRHYRVAVEALAFAATAVTMLWIVLGDALVGLVYTSRYVAPGHLLMWLAIMQAFRLLRQGPGWASLARGDPHNSLVSTAVRATWLLPTLAGVAAGAGLLWIAGCAVLGELCALLASALSLRRRHGVALHLCLLPAAWLTGWIALTIALVNLGWIGRGLVGGAVSLAALLGALTLLTLGRAPELRQLLRNLRRRRGPNAIVLPTPPAEVAQ